MNVMGVDLSLTGLGLCVIPSDWGVDWSRVRSERHGYGLPRDASSEALIVRRQQLGEACVRFARRHDVSSIWIESYAYAQRHSAHSLGELGGVVKHELARQLSLHPNTAQLSSARKLVLGKLSRDSGLTRKRIHDTVASLGARFESRDEIDAWVAANWGMAELGLYAVTAPEEPKPGRKRAA